MTTPIKRSSRAIIAGSSLGPVRPKATSRKMAFGVEESARAYRLRLARYVAMAEEVAAFVKEQNLEGDQRLKLLDVGFGSGRSMRFIDPTRVSEHIAFFGVDNNEERLRNVYMPKRWVLKRCDLNQGELPFDMGVFDMVVCEQVLEHLINPEVVLQEIGRVLRPGGLLVAGTATCWPGLRAVRQHVVPLFDRVMGMSRSHEQFFTCRSFAKLIEQAGCFSIRQVRGFRFVSGGPIAWLESFHWWYRVNRFVGAVLPWLCPDVQVVATRCALPCTDLQTTNLDA